MFHLRDSVAGQEDSGLAVFKEAKVRTLKRSELLF